VHSWVAYGFILSVGEVIDGERDKKGMTLLPISVERCGRGSFKSSIGGCGDCDSLSTLTD